jgi:hypothetical protein
MKAEELSKPLFKESMFAATTTMRLVVDSREFNQEVKATRIWWSRSAVSTQVLSWSSLCAMPLDCDPAAVPDVCCSLVQLYIR